MWKYGDAFSKDDVEKAMEYTEFLFEKYGAIPTDMNADNRKKFNQRITYILAPITKYPYLSAKISPSCVVNPRWATAHLAVYSLSDKILSRNLLDIL